MDSFSDIEKSIFAELGLSARTQQVQEDGGVFLLGAPRTGSTLLYQLMIRTFDFPYISNLTNGCFPKTPIVGLAIQKAVSNRRRIRLESNYGKVSGDLQPSEGSAVMTHWCGGGHPSQLVSSAVLSQRETHFLSTLRATRKMYGKSLLIKNAWNCFRVCSIASVAQSSKFVWIRRDIRHAALSDLQARYHTKGDPNAWNSATPSNVDHLRTLPYWAQVLENQFEFTRAVEGALAGIDKGRFIEVWYEDLCVNPRDVLSRLSMALGYEDSAFDPENDVRGITPNRETYRLPPADVSRLLAYANESSERFSDMVHPGVTPERITADQASRKT